MGIPPITQRIRVEHRAQKEIFCGLVLTALLCLQIGKEHLISGEPKRNDASQILEFLQEVIYLSSLPHLAKGTHHIADDATIAVAMFHSAYRIYGFTSNRDFIPCTLTTSIAAFTGYLIGKRMNRLFHHFR